MSFKSLHAALLFALAACGMSPSANAGEASFDTRDVATFDTPWAMAFIPDRPFALVTEKRGRIWIVDVTTGAKQEVSGAPKVAAGGQGGLLDVVVSPRFKQDSFVYLTYSEPSPNGGSGLALAQGKFLRTEDGASLTGLQVLWRDPAGGSGGQFGAIVVFAPDGQSLFLSSGERQRFTPAQDPSQPLGKILHLTLDGKPAPDNPFAGKAGAASVMITDPPEDTVAAKSATGRRFTWPGPNLTPAETWSTGHRNPYGLAFDKDGRLWETEMGPRGGDELNLIERGKNYGWPNVSNGSNYDGVDIPDHRPGDGYEPPKLFWNPSISPSSLLIYSGKLWPQWRGSGFIGALSGEALIRVTLDGDKALKADQWDLGARIRFVGEGPDGAIYLLEDASPGRLIRLTPTG
jgi:glucose/arabinose dehydrogenase